MIHYLVDAGLDPGKPKGASGQTPLHYAVRAGQVGAVSALLERGANPNAIDRFDGEVHPWSETPLDVAESPEIRALLIAHGARSGGELVGARGLFWRSRLGQSARKVNLCTCIAS